MAESDIKIDLLQHLGISVAGPTSYKIRLLSNYFKVFLFLLS